MPREAKSMLGKSATSEAAFVGGWGLLAWPSLGSGMLACATWSGGGPGGCTSLLAVEVGLVGNGTDRALARVWRTRLLWNCGRIRPREDEDEDEDDSDDVDATGIGPDSVRSRFVTS